MRLHHPFQQVDHCQWLWHHGGSHSLTYWGFLLESLGVGCTVPHHDNSILAACPQLHICILHGKTLRQQPTLGSQCLGHHVNSLPGINLPCFHRYYTGREGIYGLHVHSDNHFIVFTWAGLSHSLAVLHCGCSPLH